jgi:glycosyltransferase involved in cell wall biosynthesis
MSNLSASIVSRVRDPHYYRISKFLREAFENFQEIDPNDIQQLNTPDPEPLAKHFQFFYPLDAIDEFHSLNYPKAVRIGLSNSLDLIGIESINKSQIHFEGRLRKYHYVIVDTRQAQKLVTISAPQVGVFEVPWGIELAENVKSQITPNQRSRILLPRLGSHYYQPNRVVQACLNALSTVENLKFTLVLGKDVERDIVSRFQLAGDSRFKVIRPMEEESFTRELGEHDAVLMAPITDGTSVTMLQALEAGVIVLSSPTVGACEWITNERTGFLARSDSVEDLSSLILNFASSSEEQLKEIASLGVRLVNRFGDYKSNMASILKKILTEENPRS